MVLERADPEPSLALLVCNFAGCEQSVPVAFGERTWFLKVWTGAEAYGGADGQNALPPTAGENDSNVILAASQAALYATAN
jgi:hypothetical protein